MSRNWLKMHRTRLLSFVLVAGFVVPSVVFGFAGCNTAPRVPQLSSASSKTGVSSNVEAELGSITISVPKVTPIYSSAGSTSRLDFGNLKSVTELQKAVQQANVGISDAYFYSAAFSLGLSLAGSQINASDKVYSNANLNTAFDLAKVLNQISNGNIANTGAIGGGGGLSTGREASYTKTFKSPDVPSLPSSTAPKPDDAIAKIISLLSPSSPAPTFTLDPLTDVKLMAALHNAMVNTEAFYNFDDLASLITATPDASPDTEVWRPYRMQFLVSVTPGWYTYLKPCDATIDLKLNDPSSDSAPQIQVLFAAPDESDQVINEFTSSVHEMALALQLQGAFQAAAINSAFNSLEASARRLEGLRQNTLHIVSYPKPNEIAIRLRPAVVPNQKNTELHATSMLISAVVLVKDPNYPQKNKIQPDTKMLAAPPSSGGIQVSAKQHINVAYDGFFQPTVALKNRGLFVPRAYYTAPDSSERVTKYSAGSGSVAALLPPFKPQQLMPFGFTTPPFGFIDVDGNSATAYIAYSVSNPPGYDKNVGDSVFPDVGYHLLPFENLLSWQTLLPTQTGSVVGTVAIAVPPSRLPHLAAMATMPIKPGQSAPTLNDIKEHVLFCITRINPVTGEQENVVQEMTLPYRNASDKSGGAGAKPATVSIDAKGIKASDLKISDISPELAAILSRSLTILNTSSK